MHGNDERAIRKATRIRGLVNENRAINHLFRARRTRVALLLHRNRLDLQKGRNMKKNDPTKPSIQILVALGSIAVHFDEFCSPLGHSFDREAAKTALDAPGVRDWIKEMGPLLPLKRNQ